MGDVTSLEGELIHKLVYVLGCCSYFDKFQETQTSPQDTDSTVLYSESSLVMSHQDLLKTDRTELGSFLTQGGVSPTVLSQTLLRTPVPKTTT
jgi:hypothetical protein